MAYEFLRVEPGPVWRIVLSRPPVNVLTIAMLDELADAVDEASSQPDTGVVLLTGEGKAFCAGVDIADHTADRMETMIHAFARAVRALLDAAPPVVAALNGAALGGGLELALACDLVVARPDAKLGQPEIRLGVFPPAAAALLPRRIGVQRALDLILTGRTVKGREALPMGLVTHLIEEEDFHAAVGDYVDRLSGLSRPVVRLAKQATLRGLETPLEEALELADRLYLDDLMALHDPHEGLAAFLEKREPVWSHA